MILINKYEPVLDINGAFTRCLEEHTELAKIYEFIDLPENIRNIEKVNSSILRNYYANALDHNLLDIKTVKYILSRNIKPASVNEKAIIQFRLAEEYLATMAEAPISVPMVYQLQKILITDLYSQGEANLFSSFETKLPEKLSLETEYELEALFDFLNSDTEFHPIIQSWMLHFRLVSLPLFSEAKSKIACLLQYHWLHKHGMDLSGLLGIEHELYLMKNEYSALCEKQKSDSNSMDEHGNLNERIRFGLQLHENQLQRLRMLLKSYFRRQVDFDKLNPRQKNVMNYVFERGYKLKEIDEDILNKRQKLIMYIIQHKGFISTKELVTEFDCNRKTIQRDFSYLIDMNLVSQFGQGAALKYRINLHERKNPLIEKYQADFLKTSNDFVTADFD